MASKRKQLEKALAKRNQRRLYRDRATEKRRLEREERRFQAIELRRALSLGAKTPFPKTDDEWEAFFEYQAIQETEIALGKIPRVNAWAKNTPLYPLIVLYRFYGPHEILASLARDLNRIIRDNYSALDVKGIARWGRDEGSWVGTGYESLLALETFVYRVDWGRTESEQKVRHEELEDESRIFLEIEYLTKFKSLKEWYGEFHRSRSKRNYKSRLPAKKRRFKKGGAVKKRNSKTRKNSVRTKQNRKRAVSPKRKLGRVGKKRVKK